jgi:NAD(P)-dependent dehydrogenase (short-subunit alcohol dehydrogenase family)
VTTSLAGVAVVSGGASGIGRAIALKAAEEGARVALLDIDPAGLERVCAQIEAGGGIAHGIRCDVANADEVARAFAAAAALGEIRGCVANAGIVIPGKVSETTIADWHTQIAVNLTGVYLCCREAIIAMLAHGQGGAIVCTSSPNAESSQVGIPSYSASKGGVSALVRALAVDHAGDGIRINTIAPGATETPLMWEGVTPDQIETIRRQVNSEIPMGRIGRADEVAKAAVWLLSDEASYITGASLAVDGGLAARSAVSH